MITSLEICSFGDNIHNEEAFVNTNLKFKNLYLHICPDIVYCLYTPQRRETDMAQALYIQVAEHIRERIASGEYPLGTQIPTENELAAELGVSRPTVRQALDTLAREGRLTRVKGSGTFVSEPKLVHESTSFVTGYREESRKKHRVLRTRVVCNRVEKADERVADALRLVAGQPVTRLTRIRHLENVNGNAPVVYTTVYVPHGLFPDMSDLDFSDASLYEALDGRDLRVVHASRRLEVVMPPAEVAAGLAIGAFEPAVFITSLGYTRSGQVIEYSESYYPASRSSFQIEISR